MMLFVPLRALAELQKARRQHADQRLGCDKERFTAVEYVVRAAAVSSTSMGIHAWRTTQCKRSDFALVEATIFCVCSRSRVNS